MLTSLALATESLLDEILPHFRAYQAAYNQLAGANEAQTREFLAQLLRMPESGFIVVVFAEARVVGFATGFVTVSGVLASRMIHLGDLYVAPAHRGSNLGAQLVHAVGNEAARRGIPLVRWLSVASNERLNDWYRRLGARSHDFKLFIMDAPKT